MIIKNTCIDSFVYNKKITLIKVGITILDLLTQVKNKKLKNTIWLKTSQLKHINVQLVLYSML